MAPWRFWFYLYPPQFERDGILSLWYSELYQTLQRHEWRTEDPQKASVFFLGIDVSCAYLWPVYSAPVPGSANYVQEGRWGALGNAKECQRTRQARLEAYVRNGWAPYWGIEGKQHVVFDQLCYHPLSELVHAEHFVSLAGVGHLKGRAYGYRRGIDISWPEMPVTVEDPPLSACDCQPRKRLASFQGAGTRSVRQKLTALHDGDQIVVHVVDVTNSGLNTTDSRWEVGHPIKAPYAALMRESDFALAPAGHSQCSLRLYEIMSFCTIPVILADEKLLPFSEILNWSEMAVMVPENAAGTVPERLRALDADSRCHMRRKAHEAFHKFFANVSANVRGLLEVLGQHLQRGLGPKEDSLRVAADFRQQSMNLAWSQLAMEDFRRQRLAFTWLPAWPRGDSDKDCRISWSELLQHAQDAHRGLVLGTLAFAELGRSSKAGGLPQPEAIRKNADGHLMAESEESGLEDVLEAWVSTAFRRLDKDGSGGLDLTEFQAVGHADGQFSKLDFNNDSRVALRELLWEPLLGASLRESALRQGFLLSDSDHDGQLSGTEMERPPALRLLHLLRHNFWPGAVLDVPQAQRPCAGARAPNEANAAELRKCGYLHILPGLLAEDYVIDVLSHVQRGNCTEVSAPHAGPLAKSLPFTAPKPQLWDLLEAAMQPSECCDLVSLRLVCQEASEEEMWHGPDIITMNHYVVLVALQSVTSPVLGFIPHEKHPGFASDARNSFCGGVTIGERLRVRDGYSARYLAAGSVVIFDANLVRRSFPSSAHFLRYDLVPRSTPRLHRLRAFFGASDAEQSRWASDAEQSRWASDAEQSRWAAAAQVFSRRRSEL